MSLSKKSDIEVIGEADDEEEALDQIRHLDTNVVIIDSELPSLSGLDLTRQIRRHSPAISVIILASYEDDEQLLLAIQAGAAGYLIKSTSGQELAIR